MTILQEMRDFLDKNIEDSLENKDRNIKLICFYYGFGDAELPTLEEVAQRFDSIGTRERVRQIVARDFRGVATVDNIPSAQAFLSILYSQPYWLSSTLDATIAKEEIAGDSFSLLGLIRLLDELRIEHTYATYSFAAEKVTRRPLHTNEEFLILQKNDVARLRLLFRATRTFPGLKGIARFEDLVSEYSDFSEYKDLLLEFIVRHPDAWVRQRDDGLWFLFEDRENSLVNGCRRALTAFTRCDATRLAQSALGSLRRRSNKHRRPPLDLIEDYLRTSRHLVVNGSTVQQPPSFEPAHLNDIDEDIIQYFEGRHDVHFTEARVFLEGRGHSRHNINFALTMSPLIFVDKATSRRSHTYHLVKQLASVDSSTRDEEDRYSKFRNRLHELRGTDSTSEQSVRREQQILNQWLFERLDTEICALCGRTFSVQALVTAHKKRRADCNEGERRDPYIVMPLCKFGCDYLYEERHVYVEDGSIKRGVALPPIDGVEQALVNELVDRPLEDRWLQGPSSYFYRPEE